MIWVLLCSCKCSFSSYSHTAYHLHIIRIVQENIESGNLNTDHLKLVFVKIVLNTQNTYSLCKKLSIFELKIFFLQILTQSRYDLENHVKATSLIGTTITCDCGCSKAINILLQLQPRLYHNIRHSSFRSH